MRATSLTKSNSVFMNFGAEVHEQTFRSGGHSDVKLQVPSSQESLVLIYRATEGMKGRVAALPSPGFWHRPVARKRKYHSTTGFQMLPFKCQLGKLPTRTTQLTSRKRTLTSTFGGLTKNHVNERRTGS
ncbi:hypothetical protein TNCV_4420191 [Trichonephila clavipes]|nr:hypothetical protein TNCV_4420191 [Trichonephila clavipes]